MALLTTPFGIGSSADDIASGRDDPVEAPSIWRRLPKPPAALFAVVLGLAGWGNAWRAATQAWSAPALVGEGLHLLAALVWLPLLVLFALKWTHHPREARDELAHPVQCCFVGLAGVATMLVGGGALPHSTAAGGLLITLGLAYTLGFAVWMIGLLLRGGRDPGSTTAVLYLPSVAGSFVAAGALARWGHGDAAEMAFGMGFFSWLAIESVLLHRLYTAPALMPALRPTLGIQLAPPAAGCAAYLAITGGEADAFARALVGYALLQAMLLARMLPWIREQPFAPSYWAFTFGATALAADLAWMTQPDAGSAVAILAPLVFVVVNLVMLLISLGTVRLGYGRWSLHTQRKPT